MDIKDNRPRILIISNNALSDTNNNGKTIASFFTDYPKRKIRQLYFKTEIPTGIPIDSFYQITDSDMIKSFVNKNNSVGRIQTTTDKKNDNLTTDRDIPKNNITRIVRELIWKNNNWYTENLQKWLDDFKPEIILFVAGDTGFAFDIVTSIKKKYNSKLITYVTDDYILPRKTLNLLWWFRRNYILCKMKKTINETDIFLTISPKMRETYKAIFEKDSIVISNITKSLKISGKTNKNDKYHFVYTGGLHFNRDKVLIKLANAIANYNKENRKNKQLLLKVYTNQRPENRVIDELNIMGSSEFCGSVNSEELKTVLNDADFPVFVESSDQKAIESTRLSLSTKISEYLSLEKAIFAIGPKNISSMDYLSDVAYCVNEINKLEDDIDLFINSVDKKKLASKAGKLYKEKHNGDKQLKKLKEEIIKL